MTRRRPVRGKGEKGGGRRLDKSYQKSLEIRLAWGRILLPVVFLISVISMAYARPLHLKESEE